MARSKKKTFSVKYTGNSNKLDRNFANRKLRRVNKHLLRNYVEDETVFALLREVSDVWSFSSDGLARYMDSYIINGKLIKIKDLINKKDYSHYYYFVNK